MKVFVTKYALTQGIEEVTVEECGDGMVKTLGSYAMYFHEEGREWHRTLESAQVRAEEMRKKKIVSLKKAIKKMEGLEF